MPSQSFSKRFLVSNAQYFLPSGSIITLNQDLVVTNETAYLLAGYIPQDLALRVTNVKGKICIENIGSLPVIWCDVDNPYRPEAIIQTPILPGEELIVPYICGQHNRMYLTATAFDVNVRSNGMIFPQVLRIKVMLSTENKLHIEY